MNTRLLISNLRKLSRVFYIFLLFTSLCSVVSAQKIEINTQNKSLNKILIELRDNYGVMLSFDDKKLSGYKYTINEKFSSVEEALDYLLIEIPYVWKKRAGVYIIKPHRQFKRRGKQLISCRIKDKITGEVLPFSYVEVNDRRILSDFKGQFSYVSYTDTLFRLKVAHLGYYILDTIVRPGKNIPIKLIPGRINLDEVLVEGQSVVRTIRIESTPGTMRLNHKIANFLPGNGDNSVFNLLRLQPGILAAGEQSKDLIIWGSYDGHSQVIFDGITVFGLKNFNDNISAVNPFMAKDIMVMKGGYGVEYGERVGGLVNITGTDGNHKRISFNTNINNTTLNTMLSVPLFKKSALVLAFRKTYYNLYDKESLNVFWETDNNNSTVDVSPDYNFRDFNIKYSGQLDNGDFYYISFFGGKDKFSYSYEESKRRRLLKTAEDEKNSQSGVALFYNKIWDNGINSNITLSYSALKSRFNKELKIEWERLNDGTFITLLEDKTVTDNDIEEYSFKLKNIFPSYKWNDFEAGLGLKYNNVMLKKDSLSHNISHLNNDDLVLSAYLNDNINITSFFSIKPGIRIEYSESLAKFYLQPRISGLLKINKKININSSWGIFNQFISKSSVLDEVGNYNYIWNICNNKDIPVLRSEHFVVGGAYDNNGFTVSIDGFLKDTEGLTRFVREYASESIYMGKGRTKGLDFFIKKDYNGHSAWISYTFSKTEEYFDYFEDKRWQRALHDQRHELKLAALLNIKSFYISANYVLGSGFPDPYPGEREDIHDKLYSRLDASVIYKIPSRLFCIEAGVSVLNLLNHRNLKFSNFIRIPDDQTSSININSEAVPFTPVLFLHFSY